MLEAEGGLCVDVDHLPVTGWVREREEEERTDPSLERTTEPSRSLSLWWSIRRGCGLLCGMRRAGGRRRRRRYGRGRVIGLGDERCTFGWLWVCMCVRG